MTDAKASTGNAVAEMHYYSMIRTFLGFVGLWPYQTRGIKIVLRCLLYLSINSTFDTEMIKFFEVFGDVKHMLKCLPAILINFICLMKITSAIISEDKIRKIFDKMSSDWSEIQRKEELKILHEHSELSRKLNYVYAIYMYVAGMGSFTLVPLSPQMLDIISPLNESRPRKFMTECEYFIDQDEYFYTILIHNIVVGVIDVTLFVAFDATFISIVQHTCALFIIARFAKIVESSFTLINLIIMGFAILSLAVAGIMILVNLDDLDELFRFGSYAFGSIFHLFCYNWLGQKIVNSSEMIYKSAYECLWYEEHVSSQSKLMLCIIMQRSFRYCKLTGGKVYELSYPNFASVMKLAMSYLTVLRSMQ